MNPGLRAAISPAILLALFALAGGARGADCVLNTNPQCSAAVNLGTIAGDAASNGITRSGTGEAFYRVYVKEASSAHPRPLNARVVLQAPADTNYDLIVRCASCASTVAQSSSQGPGVAEVVNLTRADTFADNSFWIVIEVRYVAGIGCGAWVLTVNGNTAAAQGALSCS